MWKKINNYEVYEVNEFGDVRNIKVGRILKPALKSNGYVRIGLSKVGKTKMYYIHRLVADAFIPNEQNKPYVNHKDGNKKNNNYTNLEWCTPSDNNKHAYKNGLINLHTDKRKQMIKQRHLDNRKKVKILNNIGEIIGIYESLKEASLKFGHNEKYFSNVARKGHSNYKIEFMEENT